MARFEGKTPGEQHHNPLYAACTYDLDESVGVLLKKLKELGLAENTLLVFTSDNGGDAAVVAGTVARKQGELSTTAVFASRSSSAGPAWSLPGLRVTCR